MYSLCRRNGKRQAQQGYIGVYLEFGANLTIGSAPLYGEGSLIAPTPRRYEVEKGSEGEVLDVASGIHPRIGKARRVAPGAL